VFSEAAYAEAAWQKGADILSATNPKTPEHPTGTFLLRRGEFVSSEGARTFGFNPHKQLLRSRLQSGENSHAVTNPWMTPD
jgi:hypothetical protein